MAELRSLGVMTIATNKYVHYWKDLASSIDSLANSKIKVTLHVFTDEVEIIQDFRRELDLEVVIHQIPRYGWPEATLYRYRIFHENKESLKEDILMHIDADMLVFDKFKLENLEKSLSSGVCLVQHPGYFRPAGKRLIQYYLRNPKSLISDLKTLFAFGGIGAWEQNKRSSAFVPRKNRKDYFCGGIWWGNNVEIMSLCKILSKHVVDDEKSGVMASWHDESHLNWWASQNNPGIENPRYCYADTYQQISDLECFVEAIDKAKSSHG
jgi:hypothetical protein